MDATSISGQAKPAVRTSQTEKTLSVTKATLSSSAIAAKGADADEVVTISKSMEKLLDGFTGAGKKPAAEPEVGGGGGGGAGSGGGGFSSAELDRAREGKAVLEKVANARSEFADNLGKALDGLKGTFGDVLGRLGASEEQIFGAMEDFSKNLQEKMKSFDFSELAINYQESATQFSIETHGIDLVVQDGERELKISYAKSTLDLHREDQSLQAQVSKDGESAVRVGASTTDAGGKSEGMIINAKGFTPEEVEEVLNQLNKRAGAEGSGGAGGLAVLTPEKKADGVLKLKLDLSAILPPASGASSQAEQVSASATASAVAQTPKPPAGPVNLTA